MDAVYVVRPGEKNEPLRYSLRSLVNVEHDEVWIFGHAPSWVMNVTAVERPRTGSTYETVTQHIRAACLHPGVSDPFMLWNDDFYAVQQVGPLPAFHRGSLALELRKFQYRKDEWARGLRAAANIVPTSSLSYELHVPIIVHKTEMLAAIELIRREGVTSSCRRTVYGNLAQLGGTRIDDPKMGYEWPTGQWVSSTPGTFNRLAKPNLHRLFPTHGAYEVPSESVFSPSLVLAPTETAQDPQNGA